MKRLSIIGCGKLGRTLAALWHSGSVFSVSQVLNRSRSSSQEAVAFVGGGTPLGSYKEIEPADVFLIATSDGQIAECATRLAGTGVIASGTVVLHCSGSLPSEILAPCLRRGARILSVHPVKSFANPAEAIQDFAKTETFCGVEGDMETEEAQSVLRAFEAIGGRLFSIDAANKTLYHAATVFTCNYLTALIEVGIQCFAQAGISREQGMKILKPIVSGTVKNIFESDTATALTGPIARGDAEVVARQCYALDEWNPALGQLYRLLGAQALELAIKQRGDSQTSQPSFQDIRNTLDDKQ